jgi:hypothetical protein
MITRRLYFLLLPFIGFACYAQTDTIQYFDASDRSTHIDNAVYYRKISQPDTNKIYLGTEYWMDGHIKMTGHALDPNFLYKIGRFTFYYKNGKKSGEGQFYSDIEQHVFGFKNKKWETWYPDGKPKEEWVYKIAEDFTYNESFLMSFWDSASIQLTAKGEGRYYYSEMVKTKDSMQKIFFSGPVHQGRYDSLWYDYYMSGKQYAEEQYAGGKFVKGKSFDGAGNVYQYDSIETQPKFTGGVEELKRFVRLNIQFPPQKDNVIAKPVLVRVFVGRNGFVGNASIIRGATPYMNGEALRVAKTLPRFLPATVRGQPIDSYCTVPIDFLDK